MRRQKDHKVIKIYRAYQQNIQTLAMTNQKKTVTDTILK